MIVLLIVPIFSTPSSSDYLPVGWYTLVKSSLNELLTWFLMLQHSFCLFMFVHYHGAFVVVLEAPVLSTCFKLAGIHLAGHYSRRLSFVFETLTFWDLTEATFSW